MPCAADTVQLDVVDSSATAVLHQSTADRQHAGLENSSTSSSQPVVVANSTLDHDLHAVSEKYAADRSQRAVLEGSLNPVQQLEMFIQELETLRYEVLPLIDACAAPCMMGTATPCRAGYMLAFSFWMQYHLT